MDGRTRGWLAFGLGAGAMLWAIALVVAAFVVPTYSGEGCQSGPGDSTVCGSLPSQTLFAANGWWVVELLLGVVADAALAFWALHLHCASSTRGSKRAAVFLIVLLAIFAIVGSASIGLFLFPLVLLLIASATLTPLSGGRPAP
jgi:hypothetical protein